MLGFSPLAAAPLADLGKSGVNATFTGELDFTAQADGTVRISGAVSGVIELLSSSSAAALVQVTAAGNLDFTLDSAAAVRVLGAASGVVDFAASSEADVVVSGTVGATLEISSSATVANLVKGSLAVTVPFTAVSTAGVRLGASADLTLDFLSSADVAVVVKGGGELALAIELESDAVRVSRSRSIRLGESTSGFLKLDVRGGAAELLTEKPGSVSLKGTPNYVAIVTNGS